MNCNHSVRLCVIVATLLLGSPGLAGDDVGRQLERLVGELETNGHPTTREKLFSKATTNESDGGAMLLQAAAWLEEANTLSVSLEAKPSAEWTRDDWKAFEKSVARLRPGFRMVAEALSRPSCSVNERALALPALARRLGHKVLLDAHQGNWEGALVGLGSVLRVSLTINPRAETAAVVRASVVAAFFESLRQVESLGTLPAVAFREGLEPLLKDMERIELDLKFEIETLGVWLLESDRPRLEKLKLLSEVRDVLGVLHEHGTQELPRNKTGEIARRLLSQARVATAKLRLARVGLAILVHRERKGQWPAELADLGPLFDEIPADPSSKRPFSYQRLKQGVRISFVMGTLDPQNRWELRRRTG